jgi:hypothetical protein
LGQGEFACNSNQAYVVAVIASRKNFKVCSSFVASNSLDVPLITANGQLKAQNMIGDSRKASRGLE